MLERLYNVLYSENNGIIPFYYEFREGRISAKWFAEGFVLKFYMQVVGYYTRDISWVRNSMGTAANSGIEEFLNKIEPLNFKNKDIVFSKLKEINLGLNKIIDPYEYILLCTSVPHDFATTVGVEEKVVQIIDEFQYLNSEIDAGEEKFPSKCYMSTAESKVAPLLVTGSLMGVLSEQLMKYTPHRFEEYILTKMKEEEATALALKYGELYEQQVDLETARYIAYITNGVPGRITDLLYHKLNKPRIYDQDSVDKAMKYEATTGSIKRDWFEYLDMAISRYNDVNLKRVLFFLCKNEGVFYYASEIIKELQLDIDEFKLKSELDVLNKYDLIEKEGDHYGGVFDRTLKKVLMVAYSQVFSLPKDEFNTYFKANNMLDYLKDKIDNLKIENIKLYDVKDKLDILKKHHNNLKGNYYEMQVLLKLLKDVINRTNPLVEEMDIEKVEYYIKYHTINGKEFDVFMRTNDNIVVAECKNYEERYINKINSSLIDEFLQKVKGLQEEFPMCKIKTAYYSNNGFTESAKAYLDEKGVCW